MVLGGVYGPNCSSMVQLGPLGPQFTDTQRPVHFARPTSETILFYLRTYPFGSEQVPRTCLVISQLLVDPQQSMIYQFASTFDKESIPLVCMY